MSKSHQVNLSTADIPAILPTGRHQYLAHMYSPQQAKNIEADAKRKKLTCMQNPVTQAALESLVRSPPKYVKHYQHGSGLWPSPAIGPIGKPPPDSDHWWEKKPTLPGEAMLDIHTKLCDPKLYTGQYKHKFLKKDEPLGLAGDYYEKPIAAIRMLKSKRSDELQIPQRALDFKSEVTWRLTLRPLEV